MQFLQNYIETNKQMIPILVSIPNITALLLIQLVREVVQTFFILMQLLWAVNLKKKKKKLQATWVYDLGSQIVLRPVDDRFKEQQYVFIA